MLQSDRSLLRKGKRAFFEWVVAERLNAEGYNEGFEPPRKRELLWYALGTNG